MRDIRELLERQVAGLDPSPEALDATLDRVRRRGRSRRVAAAAMAFAMAAAGSLGAWVALHAAHVSPPAPAASASTSPLVVPQGRIAYLCGGLNGAPGPIPNLCVMSADGSGQAPLSGAPPGWEPAASPDGTRIAYRGYHPPWTEGDYDLYVASADGTEVTRLTFGALPDNPAWSPDGTRIAFGTSGLGSIDVVLAHGSGLTTLTPGEAGGVVDDFPTWSPDGTRIAFARAKKGEQAYEVFVMNVDGTGVAQLTRGPLSAFDPEWSPDGSTIAFLRPRAWGSSSRDIYAMNADGSGIAPLRTEGDNWNPVWVEGGTEIAFLSRRDGSTGMYLMRADGSDQTLVIPDFPAEGEFDWLNPPTAATCLSADRPGFITCRQAFDLASAQVGTGVRGHPADARIEPYREHPGSTPVEAWVVTYHGVEIPEYGPSPYASSPQCGDFGVVLDARTGAFLVAGSGAGPTTPCPG